MQNCILWGKNNMRYVCFFKCFFFILFSNYSVVKTSKYQLDSEEIWFWPLQEINVLNQIAPLQYTL